jgi:hypothetical protein
LTFCIAGCGQEQPTPPPVALESPAAPDAKSKPAPASAASATIKQNRAEFWFPVASANAVQKWGTSPVNRMEYSWFVVFPDKSATYEIGYSLFISDRNQPTTGSFEELLAAGQKNVWRLKPEGGGEVVQEVEGIQVRRRDDGLVIELTDADLLQKLRDARPAQLTFKTGGDLLGSHEEIVAVTYE